LVAVCASTALLETARPSKMVTAPRPPGRDFIKTPFRSSKTFDANSWRVDREAARFSRIAACLDIAAIKRRNDPSPASASSFHIRRHIPTGI
jgi:hypothetical protein